MQWQILTILLIALGVWIFGTLFKSEEDKNKKGTNRRGNVSGRGPVQRLVTNLDRFVEESRRRREPEERRKAPPPSRTPPMRSPLRERPKQSREAPRLATPVIAKEKAVVVLPAPRPLSPPIAELSPTLPSSKLEEGRSRPPLTREQAPPSTPTMRPLPITQQVRSLLSNPKTAATAFVLREIFDRPLCKRRR